MQLSVFSSNSREVSSVTSSTAAPTESFKREHLSDIGTAAVTDVVDSTANCVSELSMAGSSGMPSTNCFNTPYYFAVTFL